VLSTLTVRSRDTGLDPVTLTLVRERVTPLGAPTSSRFTVPVKPFWGVMVSWVVPLDPCWTVRLVGLREMVKSGGLEHAVRTAPRTSRARIKAFLITLPPLKP
jgi:hypothetical protein